MLQFVFFYLVFIAISVGIPLFLLTCYGISIIRYWQVFTVRQKQFIVYLLLILIVVKIILSYLVLALSTDWIYRSLQFCFALIAITILAVLFKPFRVLLNHSETNITSVRLSRMVIGVLILNFFALSPFTSGTINVVCEDIQRNQARLLISAAETYKLDRGSYPGNFSELIPDYVQEVPQPICLRPYTWIKLNVTIYYPEFTILHCDNDPTIVVFSPPSLDAVEIYDLSTNEWKVKDYYDVYYKKCN